MGWDGSRKVKAMGYDVLAAGLVHGKRSIPFCFDLYVGRKCLPEKERALLKELHNTLEDKGIFGGTTLFLYALNFLPPNATPQDLRTAALTAANANTRPPASPLHSPASSSSRFQTPLPPPSTPFSQKPG